MTSARKLKPAPASGGEFDSFGELQARLLKGASERIRADIREAQRRGLIDATGKRTTRELPEDMLPAARRDFGG
jgi:hypothetical protein